MTKCRFFNSVKSKMSDLIEYTGSLRVKIKVLYLNLKTNRKRKAQVPPTKPRTSESFCLVSAICVYSSPPNAPYSYFPFKSLIRFQSQWRIPRESSASISRAASTPPPPPPPPPPPAPSSRTTPPRPPPRCLTEAPPLPPRPRWTPWAAATSPGGGASGRRCAGTGCAACA